MGQRHTLMHKLADHAERHPNVKASHFKTASGWGSMTWGEYWTASREVAKGLIALGHQVGECVAIVGDNRPEWVTSQMGIMCSGGIPAPIYTNNTEEQTAYIVSHSRSRLAFCDKKEQLQKYQTAIAQGHMSVEKIITMDELGDGDKVMSLSQLRALGREQADTELDARLASAGQDETCLLIYTSGTTGVPKAVQLDQGGIMALTDAVVNRLSVLRDAPFRIVSYLPLCHVAEQAVTNFAHLELGGEVYFCPDMKQIKEYLLEAHPTCFLGVPRVWEKFEGALQAKLGEATGLKAWLTQWARKTELAAFREEVRTGNPVSSLSRTLANKLVISKVKEALGLDQLNLAVTSAAPISVGTLEFFASLGIVIHEVYGMSETTALITANPYKRPVFGTVGPALDGVTVKIAEDGEIVAKGRNMTRGYLHDPDKTAELIDEDGWLHTGDIGELDAGGNLKITGRKKDLLITAGGKNVAPAELEAYLQQIPGVGQAMVVGDRQPYLAAVLTLDPEYLGELAKLAGIQAGTIEQMAAAPEVRAYLEPRVEADCNAKVARFQTIKKFEILPVEFTVDGGEMTPTMKLKRNVVTKKYEAVIAKLYA